MVIRSVVFLLSAVFALSTLTVLAQDETPANKETPKLETTLDKASYAIGYNIGKDLKRQGLELDPKTIAQGIAASLSGAKSALSEEEVAEVFAALRQELMKKEAEKGTKNLEAGKKYLAANKAKEGVKVTKSGLQYLVIKEGDGAVPTKASTVSTHYRGTLIDGSVFDSSYKGEAPAEGDEPVSFGVTQVIKGWTEALQLMKVGSHYRLFIPSELAYGENGPGEIGANSTLIFEIYLIDSQD
jgi:FKBP-type peptidyl-prolyl cis-trans isomerase